MLIKTLLNNVERFKSLVYSSICVVVIGGMEALVIDIEPRSNSRPICPACAKRCWRARGCGASIRPAFPCGAWECRAHGDEDGHSYQSVNTGISPSMPS